MEPDVEQMRKEIFLTAADAIRTIVAVIYPLPVGVKEAAIKAFQIAAPAKQLNTELGQECLRNGFDQYSFCAIQHLLIYFESYRHSLEEDRKREGDLKLLRPLLDALRKLADEIRSALMRKQEDEIKKFQAS